MFRNAQRGDFDFLFLVFSRGVFVVIPNPAAPFADDGEGPAFPGAKVLDEPPLLLLNLLTFQRSNFQTFFLSLSSRTQPRLLRMTVRDLLFVPAVYPGLSTFKRFNVLTFKRSFSPLSSRTRSRSSQTAVRDLLLPPRASPLLSSRASAATRDLSFCRGGFTPPVQRVSSVPGVSIRLFPHQARDPHLNNAAHTISNLYNTVRSLNVVITLESFHGGRQDRC
jgi:hypothetical protein